ncbi:MAG: nucleotidyltransferase domain-containing protein [Muribaculaceae bacterium]|nr:nucleotidyltransferase domain-containing protein [Muribaculaceae bacterium]
MKLIELNIEKIASLCKKYKVKCLYVFGSILTDRFNSDSDIDFSVDFDKEKIEAEKTDWANLFFDFIHDLETLLGRKVDMVIEEGIKNYYFKAELDNTKKLIYG